MSIDVLVVGAGPVGLWTAICLKVSDPTLNIVAADQYAAYERDNPLILERSSFNAMPQHPKIQALVDEIFTKDGKQVSTVKLNTNRIEELFLNAASELNIDVRRGPENKIGPLDALKEEFRSAKIIIGADGSKSKIREEQFGALASSNDLQHIAQIKYTTEVPHPQRAHKIQQVAFMKMVRNVVTEVPKNPKEGDATGTMNLLFTVDKSTYNEIKDASFKKPYSLEQCPKTLQRRVRYWMNARHETSDSIKVSSITLNSYKSRDFVKVDPTNGRVVGLVGDAAFGVPYFRSLNNGIRCGTEFAKAAIQNNRGDVKAMKVYNSFVHRLAWWEMGIAYFKSLALRIINMYINTIGWLPEKVTLAYDRYIGAATKEYQ